MRRRAVIGVVVALWTIDRCNTDDPPQQPPQALRFATFNIENFPKHRRQVAGAFDEIAKLDVGFVALQEISDPPLLVRTARRRLGPAWDFVHVDTRPLGAGVGVAAPRISHHIGVLYDRDVYALGPVRSRDETRAGGRHKPVLEVVLRPRSGDADLRVFVVHLKSGSDGRDIRRIQLAALAAMLERSRADHPGDRAIVLGDFNATDDAGDRGDIAAAATAGGLEWASEHVACSAFWDRDDGCPRSRLDHVLTWAPPAAIRAAGACETEGCEWNDRCPLYADHVSDHCPVVVEMR